MPEAGHDAVTLAILTSRVEALCVADMLNAEGIAVHIGGYHHAGTEVIPVALGGFRLWVPVVQHEQASDLIREAGLMSNWCFSRGLQRAVGRLLGFWLGFYVLLLGSGVAIGGAPVVTLGYIPLSVLGIPVSPQGRGDYFLSPRRDPALDL